MRLQRCDDEDLDDLDDEAMKHIANLQKRRSIVLMVSLSSPLFLEGANFLGTGLILRVGNVHRDRSIVAGPRLDRRTKGIRAIASIVLVSYSK